MTKLMFLSALRARLDVLNADEINDIIDEYSGYIDSKIAEGKTEEEAVNDFGSMDDLADEILDAYKINKEYSKEYAKEYTKSNKDETHQNQAKQPKQTIWDDFFQTLGDVLAQVVDYTTEVFQRVFHGFSVEGLTQLLVVFLVALIIIAILKIPFSVIDGIGSLVIRFIFPYSYEYPIRHLWSAIVNLIYFLVSLLVIAGLIQGVIEKKDLGQSIRDMFHRSASSIHWHRSSYRHNRRGKNEPTSHTTQTESRKTAMKQTNQASTSNPVDVSLQQPMDVSTPSAEPLDSYMANENNDAIQTEGMVDSTHLDAPSSDSIDLSAAVPAMVMIDDIIGDEPIDDASAEENKFHDIGEETDTAQASNRNDQATSDSSTRRNRRKERRHRRDARRYDDHGETSTAHENRTFGRSLMDLTYGIFKLFVLILMLPVYGGMIGLAIAIGGMIYLLFQGISLYGFLILFVGILALVSTLSNMIWHRLDERKTYRYYSYKASLITSCVLLGFGSVFSFFDVMRFDHEPLPMASNVNIEKQTLYYDLTMDEQIFEFNTDTIAMVEYADLADDRMKVTLQYHNRFAKIHEYTDDQRTHFYMSRQGSSFAEFKFYFDVLIDGMRSGVIYDPSDYSNYQVTIEANANTLVKLDTYLHRVTYRK